MKLFTTFDVSASVHKAHEQFTHVVLNRGYTLIRPVFFKTGLISDLPLHQYASWISATASQLEAWKKAGGVLIEQDTNPHAPITPDATVMVECPYSMHRLELCNERNTEYGVIPHPASWKTHEECIDLRFPPADLMRAIWRVCGGQTMTNTELAAETGLPVQNTRYLKNALSPVEYWCIQKRLAPERDEFVLAWDWLTSADIPRQEITKSGFRPQIEEMARFGYINLRRILHFPRTEPDWGRIDRKREEALTDLAAVRTLVESLPDHLAE